MEFCAREASQILGGASYVRGNPVERLYREVRVNAIAPGWIHTDMTDPLEPLHPFLEMQTPMGRLGEPDDIAWCAVYLASQEAGFVTGQTLMVDGGASAI